MTGATAAAPRVSPLRTLLQFQHQQSAFSLFDASVMLSRLNSPLNLVKQDWEESNTHSFQILNINKK
jgi:hypothetical protein